MTADAYDLVVRQADLSKSAPPRWAWEHWLVIGYLNLLLGNEGIGKGTLVCWLIARLTKGELPGDLAGKPIGVGILGDEDSFYDVWVPRLHGAGADLSRVFQVERPDGGFVNITEDRERLGRKCLQHDLGALFLDQLLDNLGAGTDDWRQKAVRDALQPIRALARELEILILGALHPNKRADSFRQLVSGAAAFNAVSRSSLLLAQHPDDETLRVLARGKGNLSKRPDSIEFRIEEYRFAANGHQFQVPVAIGFTAGTLTVDDLLGNESVRQEHSKVAEACEIIEALLPKDGEWHPAREIKEACAAEGIDERMAKRAKERLAIRHRRTSTYPSVTEWCWPSSQDAVRSSASTVPTSPTSPTANGPKPLQNGSWASRATQDTENASPDCVPTIQPGQTYEQWSLEFDKATAA